LVWKLKLWSSDLYLKTTLYLTVVLCGLLGAGCSEVQARETYRQLMGRMVQEASTTHAERPDLERQLWQLANEFRKAKGLKALKSDEANHGAAVAHAMDMLQHNYMGHVASSGHDFDSRMRALRDGAMILPSIGENAARLNKADVNDPQAAQKIFQQWVKSPSHRHTLLSRDYVTLATGVVAMDGKIYADQIFVGPEVQSNMGRAVPEQADGSLY
jgi:uncharacterized protein YkwD